jgi:hypothetical protein
MRRIFTLILAVTLASILSVSVAFGQRPYYGGGKHTTSHGGSYPGSSGSSHRGGHYKEHQNEQPLRSSQTLNFKRKGDSYATNKPLEL